MIRQPHRLSRHCRLETTMLPGVLRRTSAAILAKSTSEEERCRRMDRSHNSTYLRYYQNPISTVDAQALRHNVEPTNVGVMPIIFLGTDNPQHRESSPHPPTKILKSGLPHVLQGPGLVSLLTEQAEPRLNTSDGDWKESLHQRGHLIKVVVATLLARRRQGGQGTAAATASEIAGGGRDLKHMQTPSLQPSADAQTKDQKGVERENSYKRRRMDKGSKGHGTKEKKNSTPGTASTKPCRGCFRSSSAPPIRTLQRSQQLSRPQPRSCPL